jgi:hypothetical protein
MNLSVRRFKIRERRTTRNMGVYKTAHRRVIKGLILPPNHQFSDEPILYRRFMDGIRAIPGAGQVPGKPWISSNNGSFYTKLVLYKDMRFEIISNIQFSPNNLLPGTTGGFDEGF